jgi:hypothetical protein
MRRRDVYQREMRELRVLSDAEVDRLLSGDDPRGDGTMSDLAAFFAQMERVEPEPSTEGCESEHLAAIFESVRRSPVGEPRSQNGAGPRVQVDTRRRRPPLRVGLAIAFAVALMAFGTLAVAGELPDDVQGVVSDVCDKVGLHIPRPDRGVPDDRGGRDAGSRGARRDNLRGHRPQEPESDGDSFSMGLEQSSTASGSEVGVGGGGGEVNSPARPTQSRDPSTKPRPREDAGGDADKKPADKEPQEDPSTDGDDEPDGEDVERDSSGSGSGETDSEELDSSSFDEEDMEDLEEEASSGPAPTR